MGQHVLTTHSRIKIGNDRTRQEETMKYGFIGCGNMGSAIATALSKTTKSIVLSDRSGKAISLAEKLGIQYDTPQHVAEISDRLFLAVKPQVLPDILAELAPTLRQKKPVLISMAAGIEIGKIVESVGAPLPVIRIMPNTPVLVGNGTTLFCYNSAITQEIITDFLSDMKSCGLMDNISEKLMDAASAVAGCGPAYAYIFVEAMADAAVACGIPRDKAIAYAANMLIGAGQMVIQTQQHPGALKDAVSSPGGSTIAGIKVLEDAGFRGIVMDCIVSAYHRTQELGK